MSPCCALTLEVLAGVSVYSFVIDEASRQFDKNSHMLCERPLRL